MRTFTFGLIIFSFLSILSGCAPAICTDSPEVIGQVVDKQTGLPISNAKVEHEDKFGTGIPETTTKTDEFGGFHIDKNSTLTFVPLFLTWDFPPNGSLLKINADNYKEFIFFVGGRHPITITIELEPNGSTEAEIH